MKDKIAITIYKKEINDEEMSITAWGNKSDSIDRSGDLIEDSAWDLTNFLKNPVIAAFHNYYRPPVGKAMWVKVVPGQGLRFKIKFAATEEGEEFYQLYKDGIMSAFSVGFMPREWVDKEDFDEKDVKKYSRNGEIPKRVYKNVELFELSCVVVPDHMNALMERSEKGFIKTKGVMDFVEEVKKSPEYMELISKEKEEKEEKLDYKPDLDLHTDNIDLNKADQIDIEKYQEKDVAEKKSQLGSLNTDEKIDLEQKEQIEKIEETKEENSVAELDLIIEEFKEIDNAQEITEIELEEKKDLPEKTDEFKNSLSEDVDNRVKLLKFFIKYADKEIIDEFAKIISDKDDISIEEILVKALEQIKFQKKEIQDLKTGVKKEIEEDITTKSIDFIEVEVPVNKEVDLDFDLVKVKDIFLQNIEKTFGEIDLSDLIDERLKKAKGVIEFED